MGVTTNPVGAEDPTIRWPLPRPSASISRPRMATHRALRALQRRSGGRVSAAACTPASAAVSEGDSLGAWRCVAHSFVFASLLPGRPTTCALQRRSLALQAPDFLWMCSTLVLWDTVGALAPPHVAGVELRKLRVALERHDY